MSNHSSEDVLFERLISCHDKVVVGGTYYHYRKPLDYYKVLAVALDEATEKIVVIYQAQYGKNLTWVRDIDKWCERVEHDGLSIPRFSLVIL